MERRSFGLRVASVRASRSRSLARSRSRRGGVDEARDPLLRARREDVPRRGDALRGDDDVDEVHLASRELEPLPPPLLPPPFAPPPTLSAVLGDNVASIAGGLLLATVWLAVKCARRRNTRNTRALKGAKLAMEELGAEAMPPDSSSTKWVVGDTEMGAQPAPVTVPGMDTDPARERDSAAAPAGQEAQNKEAHNGEEPGKMKPRGAKAKKKLPKGARKGKADAESLQGLVPAAEVVDQTPRLERKLPPLNLDLD